jgi:hypothetical protein
MIDLGPGEPGPDVVVIAGSNLIPIVTALAARYPGSQVTTVTEPARLNIVANIQRIQIPFASLSGGSPAPAPGHRAAPSEPEPGQPVPAFKVRLSGANEWARYYYMHLGLGRGVIWSQDRSADLNAPHQRCDLSYGAFTSRFEGGLHVDKAGRYRMSYSSNISAIVKVDGKRIVVDIPLFRKGRSTESHTLRLGAGEHKIEMICDFPNGVVPAPVLEFRPASEPQSPPMPMGAPPLERPKG